MHVFFTESNILTFFSSALWGKKSWWTTFQFDCSSISKEFSYYSFYILVRIVREKNGWCASPGFAPAQLPVGVRGAITCLVCHLWEFFFWKCKCKLGFWRESGAVSPALSGICVTKNISTTMLMKKKNKQSFLVKMLLDLSNYFCKNCCSTCQT